MVEVLQNAGYTKTHAMWANGDFIQVHFDGKRNNPLIYRDNGVVVIPMRDKAEVTASWQRRNRQLQELEEMWSEMEAFVKTYEPHIYFVHIDDPGRRETELAALGEKLGSFLVADFSVKVGQGQ